MEEGRGGGSWKEGRKGEREAVNLLHKRNSTH